jgi:myosin heavy subunit
MSSFNYLGNRDTDKHANDAAHFAETVLCLSRIGLGSEDQKAVFGMAAAVLHLGNIEFEEIGEDDDQGFEGHSEYAKISEASLGSLRKACELLGLDEEKLTEAMLTKALNIGGKTIKKPQNVAMAADKRDALAKMTYSCLFLWLVKCVNKTLNETSQNSSKNSDKVGFIGVLDIYGFECFEVNGYEQLLINYCNEKLQRHFNRHLFEVEQELYAAEGVDWSYITFNDNRPCLDLIEGGSGVVGILNTLDDAWGGMGTAQEKDSKFVAHLHKQFGTVTGGDSKMASSEAETGHKNFLTPKFGNDRMFVIVHYAGEVSLSRAISCWPLLSNLTIRPPESSSFVSAGTLHCRRLCREEYGDTEQRTSRAW